MLIGPEIFYSTLRKYAFSVIKRLVDWIMKEMWMNFTYELQVTYEGYW